MAQCPFAPRMCWKTLMFTCNSLGVCLVLVIFVYLFRAFLRLIWWGPGGGQGRNHPGPSLAVKTLYIFSDTFNIMETKIKNELENYPPAWDIRENPENRTKMVQKSNCYLHYIFFPHRSRIVHSNFYIEGYILKARNNKMCLKRCLRGALEVP